VIWRILHHIVQKIEDGEDSDVSVLTDGFLSVVTVDMVRLYLREVAGRHAYVYTERHCTDSTSIRYACGLAQKREEGYYYSLRPIIFFPNMDVSTTKMCLDTFILVKSIIDRRD
jgi:hypothetical protein